MPKLESVNIGYHRSALPVGLCSLRTSSCGACGGRLASGSLTLACVPFHSKNIRKFHGGSDPEFWDLYTSTFHSFNLRSAFVVKVTELHCNRKLRFNCDSNSTTVRLLCAYLQPRPPVIFRLGVPSTLPGSCRHHPVIIPRSAPHSPGSFRLSVRFCSQPSCSWLKTWTVQMEQAICMHKPVEILAVSMLLGSFYTIQLND